MSYGLIKLYKLILPGLFLFPFLQVYKCLIIQFEFFKINTYHETPLLIHWGIYPIKLDGKLLIFHSVGTLLLANFLRYILF